MGKIVHQSKITITREKGPTRRAEIEGFAEPVYYGVHGGIKKFYNVTPEEEHAATLDHIVGAVGGWMMGTLASVMAGKKIRTFQDRFTAKVTGDIENVDGILKITRIEVVYFLKLPDRQQGAARECFDDYIDRCPAAQSVIGCIDISHSLDLEIIEDWPLALLSSVCVCWDEREMASFLARFSGDLHLLANVVFCVDLRQ